MTSACPSCGAELRFKSSISVFAVCEYCKSMIVRHDMDLESLGKMAQLPDDVSPIKLGSVGKYGSSRFEVIGRLKIAWSEGYWNEWFLRFDDGSDGWLGEAMGLFMLSRERKKTESLPPVGDLYPGKSYELAPSKSFIVDDIKEATCIGSEGELPFKGLLGRTTTSVDLGTNTGDYACIEYSEQDGVRLFIGRYVTFDSMDFSNLRDLERELKRIRSAELFKCPSCGGSVSMLTPGLTAAVVCTYCGSTIDATNKNLAILSEADKKISIKPRIPLGSAGSLLGARWEVIGFMRRTDASGVYPWDEYLLFNPYKGFRWLTTENGHWNFVEMVRFRTSLEQIGDVHFRDRIFKRFLVGSAKVEYVLGEFYWRVKTGEMVGVEDYIAPPDVLSCERYGSETTWSVGTYVESDAIQKAFNLKETLPSARGVAPNQISPYGKNVTSVVTMFAIVALCLTLFQTWFAVRATGREVFHQDFAFNPQDTAKTITSQSFEIPGNRDTLKVILTAPVQNDWIETGIDLIDDATQQTVEFEQGVEYYSGHDYDGSWSEGSQSSESVLSSIPGGRYHLAIQPSSSPAASGKGFSLSIRRGVTIWSNYLITLLLLAIYPLYLWCRRRAFEVARWSNSDFSPYAQDNEGD